MRILKLHIHNFKVFDDVEFDFTTHDAVILCGRNGFGKTSIFDALELLFTGRIDRYEKYGKNYHDGYLKIKDKQFIHNERDSEIYIEATIELAKNVTAELRIDGDPKKLNVPVKFSQAFHYSSASELPEIKALSNHYLRLNYMSQDDSTEFLKRKEDNRSEQIETLFRTDKYDEQLHKLNLARKAIAQLISKYQSQIAEKVGAIAAYDAKIKDSKESGEDVKNLQLFKDDSMHWDLEEPNLTTNEIDAIIKDGGELDKINYFINHRSDYVALLDNQKIDKVQNPSQIHKIAVFLKYNKSKSIFDQYKEFKNSYLKYYNELTIENIVNKHLSYSSILSAIISKEQFDTVESLQISTVNMLKTANKLQIACNRILDSRRQIERDLTTTEFTKCPVCGNDYENKDALLDHVRKYDQEFLEQANRISQSSADTYANYRRTVSSLIIEKLTKYFSDNGITDELYKEFEAAKDIQSTDEYKVAMYYINSSIKTDIAIEAMEREINNILQSSRKDISEGVDAESLLHIGDTYAKHLRINVTKDDLNQKRKWLLGYQLRLSVSLRKKNNDEVNKIKKLIEKYEKYNTDFKKLEDAIDEAKTNYIDQVISDIEILFYIYSGRIMQDSYYGRGVFLKRKVSDSNVSRILFVTGSYNSNLDVLYNMSSGQLISVAIAFLLALNKLYDNAGLLAIDDPVQTIDDINLWGLIETIRHEFANKNILLSTHEDDSAALIRYKLAMMGRNAYALDMSTVHKTRKDDNHDE